MSSHMEEMQRGKYVGGAVSIHVVSGHPTLQASAFSSLESHWTASSWVFITQACMAGSNTNHHWLLNSQPVFSS